MEKKRLHILLVNVQPEEMTTIESTIDKDTYQLLRSSSPNEAYDFLSSEEVALIIIDVDSPKLNWFAVVNLLKTNDRTKHIPILLITGTNIDQMMFNYPLEMNDYILKPLDPWILNVKIEGFINIFKSNQMLKKQFQSKGRDEAFFNQKSVEAELKQKQLETLLKTVEETSFDGIVITDNQGVIVQVNTQITSLLSYSEPELAGTHISLLFSGRETKKFLDYVFNNPMAVNANPTGEVTIVKKDGTILPALIKVGSTNNHLIFTIRDLTRELENKSYMEYIANHDSLTGLANRSYFRDHLIKAIRKAKHKNEPLGVLFAHINHFRHINDSLGYIIGDMFLREAAKRMNKIIREQDFISRSNGAEFGIILPNANREQAVEIAEILLKSFQSPFFVHNYEVHLSLSIGLSMFPYDGEDINTLKKHAKEALLRAKEEGGNSLKVFHSRMDNNTYRTFILQQDFYEAMKQKQLEIYYQPRLHTPSGSFQSAEALVYWKHNQLGLIYPEEFLSLSLEPEQLEEISLWALNEICKRMHCWQESGLAPIRVALTFSAK